MHSYTVTIGRNYTNDGETFTLSDESWLSFQGDVRHILFDQCEANDHIEQHNGAGQWAGVWEESAKITLLRNEILPAPIIKSIEEHLRELLRPYDQDAIALTIGTSILVGAL